MAQINRPDQYFNTKLYTGNGTDDTAITGVGFQPDWVWIKNRDSAINHGLFDIVRGAGERLSSNLTDAEVTRTDNLTSFDSDGFTVNNGTVTNSSSTNYTSWNWLAGGTASSNTDGSITSNVSASTTSGFSIVSWTGNGTSGANIGHSLGVAPSMIISKNRDNAENWFCYHKSLGATQYIRLNLTNTSGSATSIWNDTEPTSSVFTVGNDTAVNTNGVDYIAYCFAEKKGFSKFGSYTGNGNADGTFIYTGFKPAFVMLKRSSNTSDWYMFDNKREGYNVDNDEIYANLNYAEDTADRLDILSNGFKMRTTGGNLNGSGETFIYMAFAENPLVGTNNIPATAR